MQRKRPEAAFGSGFDMTFSESAMIRQEIRTTRSRRGMRRIFAAHRMYEKLTASWQEHHAGGGSFVSTVLAVWASAHRRLSRP